MFHANLPALLRRRLVCDVDSSEDAEQRGPEDEEDPVPAEGPVGLEEGYAVDEDCEGAETAYNFGEDPFAVYVAVHLVCLVKVHTVETTDCEGENELDEAQYHAQKGACKAARVGVVANA